MNLCRYPIKKRKRERIVYVRQNTEVHIMSDRRNKERKDQNKEVLRAARIAEEAIVTATAARTTRKRGGVTIRNLNPDKEKPKSKERGAYRVSFKEISESTNGYVNALHTESKLDVRTSVSAHVAFRHNVFGEIISIIIPKNVTAQRQQKSKKLADNEIGAWVKENVTDWKKGIWFSRIGHTNIISDQPLDLNKNITGYVVISSKRVEQNTRKGKNTYYFPHIIILGTREKTKPVFTLVINNTPGNNTPGEVHIGPTIGALRDNKKVEEYLHLIPY